MEKGLKHAKQVRCCENDNCVNPVYFVVHLEPGKDIMLCKECKRDYVEKFICEKYKCETFDEWARLMVASGKTEWPEYPNWRPL